MYSELGKSLLHDFYIGFNGLRIFLLKIELIHRNYVTHNSKKEIMIKITINSLPLQLQKKTLLPKK